jgi:hypothetical protein
MFEDVLTRTHLYEFFELVSNILCEVQRIRILKKIFYTFRYLSLMFFMCQDTNKSFISYLIQIFHKQWSRIESVEMIHDKKMIEAQYFSAMTTTTKKRFSSTAAVRTSVGFERKTDLYNV